jgi:pyruvate dehydrogenase E2 component (dihydrolipoamide acetyltransferase)
VAQEVRIPDIGDIDEVEVIEICVAVGDQVGPDDALIVIESDKASMEVPAGTAGTIASIDVALGDQVAEGALVVTLEGAAAETAAEQETASREAPAADKAPAAPQDTTVADRPSAPAQPASVEVRVPDIGEATDVVVIEVAVAPGAEVSESDLLVVVESDKASMEIPAGQAGIVTAVHVEEGSEVAEGTLIATIESAPGSVPDADVAPPAEAPAPVPPATQPAAPSTRAPTGAIAAQPDTDGKDARGAGDRVYASPAVRRLARELGVALEAVKGSGAKGRILKDDVKSHVKAAMTEKGGSRATGAGIPPIPAVDFSRFGPVEISPLSRIRAAGAANLHRSWLNLPHVTQFEEADVTELEVFRKTLKEEATRRDVKITPLAFIIKACCYALQEFPTFNASLDPEIKNFVLKRYYHIGFAVDTPDGLVVPVIREADRMGVWDLSEAITELAEKARTGKLGMNDLQGGSFSISSLGNIGGTGFTPIINAPEVAILGVSKLVTKPMWNGSDFEPRQMLPLSLSYDHRAINGAEAGRFMVMLAELLGDIRRLAL